MGREEVEAERKLLRRWEYRTGETGQWLGQSWIKGRGFGTGETPQHILIVTKVPGMIIIL